MQLSLQRSSSCCCAGRWQQRRPAAAVAAAAPPAAVVAAAAMRQPPQWQQQQQRRRRRAGACAAVSDAAAAAAAGSDDHASVSPAATPALATTELKLKKPLGLVFAQNAGGPVFVESVAPGSNADKSGAVAVGDVLSACSATVLKAGKGGEYEREGYGQRPYDNFERVVYSAEGQSFKDVATALRSNSERWGITSVTLLLRKPRDAAEAALCRPKEEQQQQQAQKT